MIALNSRSQDVLAIGHEAWQMIGRTPGYIVAVRPLRQGAITDFDITERMIRLLLQRCGVSRFNRPRVLICVPSAITSVERRAVTEAARRAGASEAVLMEQPMAAAIGAGLQIHEPVGNMVVDVGGGTSESAVISLGGIVAVRALRCGGFDLDCRDPALREACSRDRDRRADRRGGEARHRFGRSYPDEVHAEVRGREVMTGMPRVVKLSPEEVREAIEEQIRQIVERGCGMPRGGPTGTCAGHHLPRYPSRGRRIASERPGEPAGERDSRPGSRGRHSSRVRSSRSRTMSRIVRLAAVPVHGRGLTS